MSSRPRRSAAQRATAAITDLADRDNNDRIMSSSRRQGGASKPGVTIASGADDAGGKHIHLTVKVPSSKLRQATSGSGSAIVAKARETYGAGGRRATRGGKKSYVVESDSDEEDEVEVEVEDDDEDDDVEEEEDEEEEGEDEIQVGSVRPAALEDEDEDAEGEDEEMGDEDAERDEDIMDVDRYRDDNDDEALVGDDGYGEDDEDAEGEDDDDALGDEDADGDIDMDTPAPPAPTIKISRPGAKSSGKTKIATPSKKASSKSKVAPQKGKAAAAAPVNDDDDDELSDLDSEADDMDDTVKVGGGDEDAEGEEDDMDAEGEEIEVAEEDAEGEDDDDGLGSDDEEGSRAETPDVSRMTARQRAKHGDVIQEYMKLSDEVQVKKHFTAEELSMRRAEMARRRRNLSEKRNEEVKMETINKLLKKQAPKTNRRVGHLPGEDTPPEFPKPNPIFIRWVSSQKGSIVAVPEEIVEGPAGRVFVPGGLGRGKMVEEVS